MKETDCSEDQGIGSSIISGQTASALETLADLKPGVTSTPNKGHAQSFLRLAQ